MAESKSSGSVVLDFVHLFESLIRRNIAPSLGFFALLAAADLVRSFLTYQTAPMARVNQWLEWLDTKEPSTLAIAFLLALVGLSYVLAALHQMLYDDQLRGDFAGWPKFLKNNENTILENLREKVRGKLEGLDSCLKKNDYLLYQVLIKVVPPGTVTRSYVDRAKALGITAISAQLVLLLLAAGLRSWWLLLPIPFLFLAGREAVIGRYRSRAVRLYAHYLVQLALPSTPENKQPPVETQAPPQPVIAPETP